MTNKEYIDVTTGQIYESAESALQAHKEFQKVEREKKNPPFIQLYKSIAPKIITALAKEYPIAVEILMFLLDNMDGDNAICVSQSVIGESIDRSKPSVIKGIRVLKEHGAIGVGYIGRTAVYIVNPEMAWQKANKSKRYAKMKGTFILGEDENKKLFETFRSVADKARVEKTKSHEENVKTVNTKTLFKQ